MNDEEKLTIAFISGLCVGFLAGILTILAIKAVTG